MIFLATRFASSSDVHKMESSSLLDPVLGMLRSVGSMSNKKWKDPSIIVAVSILSFLKHSLQKLQCASGTHFGTHTWIQSSTICPAIWDPHAGSYSSWFCDFSSWIKINQNGWVTYSNVNSINAYPVLSTTESLWAEIPKHASITVAAWVASKYFRTVPANDANMLSHLRSYCDKSNVWWHDKEGTSNPSGKITCYPWTP